jgi:hypothetical protein
MNKTYLQPALKRRTVLGVGAAMFAAVTFDLSNSASAQSPDERSFLELSQKLTGRSSLDQEISGRALAALTAENPSFPAAAAELATAMKNAGLVDMRQFKTFAADHPDVAATAYKIISAWYLGHTGTPAAESTVDDARFVSYAGALMYEPTIDVTVIPTYARGRTNYWFEPPATLATD